MSIAIADRLAPYNKTIREAIDQSTDLKDAGTADLYTEISRTVDKYLWLLLLNLRRIGVLTRVLN